MITTFRGINKLFLKYLAPDMLKQHNLSTMNIASWKNFEKELNIQPLFKDYIGGFEPVTFLVKEKSSLFTNLLFFKARILSKLFHNRSGFSRKCNSQYFSGYIMGVYKKI